MDKKDPEKLKIRREIIFAAAALLLVILSTFEEARMIHFSNVSLTSKIIVYAYINITVVLFLFMAFLVLRNVIKLVVERKKGVIGAKLRTKLVGLFVIVSIVPAIFMFIVMIASGFAANVINKWYSERFEKAMSYLGAIVHSASFPGNSEIARKAAWLSRFYREYSQIRFIKNPVETTYLIFFSIFTLIILFISSWVGFYLSKKITRPVIDLVEGTKRLASGDPGEPVSKNSDDEIGMLVDSFNSMASELTRNREEIEIANAGLKSVNEEIDRRRKYMEIVLKNIRAGVIAVDASGKIRSINNAAEEIFGIKHSDAVGKNYKDVFDKAVFTDIRSMIKGLAKGGVETVAGEIKLNSGGEPRVYIVTLAVLKDEADSYVGFVIVLNDTTDMMKAQRVAAWEEVAKRMSHEIKNPLTPIKLSAERLKRKYGGKIGEGDTVFGDSIDTIIKEVDDLKNLVDEFSLYARLPEADFHVSDINSLADEVVSLYRNAHKDIDFFVEFPEGPCYAVIDRRQMKRAFMNIIDNAVFSVLLKSMEKPEGYKGQVKITAYKILPGGIGVPGSSNQNASGIIKVVFSDNGTGIKEDVMQNIYEPYFSTKQGGTGLGLAITKNIAIENNASISASNNGLGGADFAMELKAAEWPE